MHQNTHCLIVLAGCWREIYPAFPRNKFIGLPGKNYFTQEDIKSAENTSTATLMPRTVTKHGKGEGEVSRDGKSSPPSFIWRAHRLTIEIADPLPISLFWISNRARGLRFSIAATRHFLGSSSGKKRNHLFYEAAAGSPCAWSSLVNGPLWSGRSSIKIKRCVRPRVPPEPKICNSMALRQVAAYGNGCLPPQVLLGLRHEIQHPRRYMSAYLEPIQRPIGTLLMENLNNTTARSLKADQPLWRECDLVRV